MNATEQEQSTSDAYDEARQRDKARVEELEEKARNLLDVVGSTLAKTRDEWIAARLASGWDKDAEEDNEQYNSTDAANRRDNSLMETVAAGYPQMPNVKPNRSTVFIGMTRQKTNGAEARLADILLPTDESNFSIRPTPDAKDKLEASDQSALVNPNTGTQVLRGNGKPITVADVAKRRQEKAVEAANAMQKLVEDQQAECDAKGELRKVLHNAAVFGTGVLKGPVVRSKTRERWKKIRDPQGLTVYTVEKEKVNVPVSENVDPRMVWEDPACGDDVQNGRGIYELEYVTAKQIRALAQDSSYIKAQLVKVLKQGPQMPSNLTQSREDREAVKDRFCMWSFWGQIEHKDAVTLKLADEDEDEDEALLKTYDVGVVLINDFVVKAFLSPLETGELPFDFYPWEKVAGKARGKGVPRLMRSQQKVLNAAWRAMMDNAGTSSGVQLVMKSQGVQPADGVWEVRGNKVWWVTDQSVDVRNVFATFTVDSTQEALAGIVQMATQLADEETAVPMIMQGNERSAPETVGAMQMLMNASNVVLRRLVKQFDDYITRKHMRRYYHFNMLYSEDDTVKGDFEVDARGSSALLVRDVKNQALMNLLAAGMTPILQPYVDVRKVFEKVLQSQHVDPRDVMYPDEKIEENLKAAAEAAKQQPQDTSVQVANIRSKTELQKAGLVQKSDMAELQFKRESQQIEHQNKMREALMRMETELYELAQDERISLESIRARLAEIAIQSRTDKELFNREAALKLSVGSGI